MATLGIEDLDDAVRRKLRRRAAQHGRSMAAEIRDIRTRAVTVAQIGEGIARH
ncbi:Arc family DNA-binding protein [Micromonospora sp. NPDC002389]|uniref:FitA-like ribbon-helix-helix domain-containing protein n=1 Tax=Micromonospora sp. NPDC002389 TaxID=3154272 RepID=UPI003330B80A